MTRDDRPDIRPRAVEQAVARTGTPQGHWCNINGPALP